MSRKVCVVTVDAAASGHIIGTNTMCERLYHQHDVRDGLKRKGVSSSVRDGLKRKGVSFSFLVETHQHDVPYDGLSPWG